MPFVRRLSPEARADLRASGMTDEAIDAALRVEALEARRCPDCQRYSCSCAADHQREVAAFREGRQP